MTRPIYEPTPTRTDAVLGYGQDQLQRRPAPIPSAVVEYARTDSVTNLGTSFTPLDFTALGGGSYDTGPPTFDINANGNLEINKDGFYVLQLLETQMVLNANVNTEALLRIRRISGETPLSMVPSFASGEFPILPRRINHATTGGDDVIDVRNFMGPDYSTVLVYGTGSFPGGLGPSEIEISAYHEEDEVGVATTFPVFILFVYRIGAPYA